MLKGDFSIQRLQFFLFSTKLRSERYKTLEQAQHYNLLVSSVGWRPTCCFSPVITLLVSLDRALFLTPLPLDQNAMLRIIQGVSFFFFLYIFDMITFQDWGGKTRIRVTWRGMMPRYDLPLLLLRLWPLVTCVERYLD